MIRRIVALSLFVATGVAIGADPLSVDLRYRSYRNWAIDLPSERWFPVSDGIEIAEAKFPVKMLGNELRFDTDGDGELDRTIKPLLDLKTGVSTTRVILSATTDEGKEIRYAVRLRDDANGWEWAPGGAMAGNIPTKAGPLPIRIIDQNGNGRFDDYGQDAMIVGASDHAMYLSKTVFVDNRLRAVEVNSDGSRIGLGDYDGPTSIIDMTTSFESKAVLLSAVLLSKDRLHSFDVGAAIGPIEVPSGTYNIAGGLLGLGDHRVTIGAGKMKPVELAPDESSTVDWGGPTRAEFQFARSGDQVKFSSNAIWYFGDAGEEYSGWRPIGKSPEFKIIDAKTGVVLEVAILPGSC